MCLGVAIPKYRLYDIDRIISRTLAYAIVTGPLTGLYAGLVLLATRVLSVRTPVAVAASTLAAAALFNPLRGRVQRAVDRRFNRARYDADQTVAAFAARLKDDADLDSVRDDLAGSRPASPGTGPHIGMGQRRGSGKPPPRRTGQPAGRPDAGRVGVLPLRDQGSIHPCAALPGCGAGVAVDGSRCTGGSQDRRPRVVAQESSGWLVPGYHPKPRGVALRAERRSGLSVNTVLAQERRDPGRVDEHILVVFAVTPPGTVRVGQERGDVPDEPVCSRHREFGDDRPILTDLREIRGVSPGTAPFQITDIKGKQSTRTQRSGDRDQRPVDRPSIREVAERVTDGHDRVGLRQRVIGQRELTHFLRRVTYQLAGDIEHRRRRIGGDDAMTGSDQFLSEQAGPAPKLEHQPPPGIDRGQESQDSRSARSSVEPEAPVMHDGKIAPIGGFWRVHPNHAGTSGQSSPAERHSHGGPRRQGHIEAPTHRFRRLLRPGLAVTGQLRLR